MAHFAKVDVNNTVTQVIVIDNNDVLDEQGVESEAVGIKLCQDLLSGEWVQTSYNSNMRKNYAGVGFTYDVIRDAFIAPQPDYSCVFNEDTCRWEVSGCEYTIKSNGVIKRLEFKNYPGDAEPSVVRDLGDGTIKNEYKTNDLSCDFYSDREEGRKKYWKSSNYINPDKYSQNDSDAQELAYYGEIEGVTQEWYYSFSTFEGMMQFVDTHKPINLSQPVQTKMKDNPKVTRPSSILNPDHNYGASVEVTATGDKTTSVYVWLTADVDPVFVSLTKV